MKDIQYFQIGFKTIPREKKAEGGESLEGLKISGYASTPTKDRYSDIVEPEAFRESIVTNYKNNPIILFQHDANRPIGKAVFMNVDNNGLFIKAIIYDKEVAQRIEQGVLRTFSIGFIPKKIRFEDENGKILDPAKDNIWDESVKRIIEKVDLVENSIVSTPANPDALFTMEKSVKSFFSKMEKAELKNINNPITSNDMKKKENLLEAKDEGAVEETTPESTENAETPGETPESVEEATPATPADETSGKEEGAETNTDEEAKPTEGEEVEEEKEEEKPEEAKEEVETPEKETEEAPAEEKVEEEAPTKEEETPEEAEEKSLISKIMTKEGAAVALNAVMALQVKVAELEAIIKETPTKRAQAYFESSVTAPEGKKVGVDSSIKDEKEEEKPKEDKKGFIEALQKAAV